MALNLTEPTSADRLLCVGDVVSYARRNGAKPSAGTPAVKAAVVVDDAEAARRKQRAERFGLPDPTVEVRGSGGRCRIGNRDEREGEGGDCVVNWLPTQE